MSGLRTVVGVKPIYFVPRQDIVGKLLIPCLQRADAVDCMVGFFSAQSLSIIAPGLASFISNSANPLRLIICPVLAPADRDAIEKGYKTPETVVEEFLSAGLTVSDELARHTLRCLAYLISVGRIDIRVAVMKGALFHPKVWLISSGEDTLAVHGSGNFTVSGLSKNYEQITVDNSWTDANSKFVVDSFRTEFDDFWSRTSHECTVYDFPDAVAKQLVREHSGQGPPTESELLVLLAEQERPPTPVRSGKPLFAIPLKLNYTTGDFAHQGKAATAFVANGFRGIFAMATGSGKTITSMIAAHSLYQKEKRLLIVIAAPYIPLISQWCEEIAEFGLEPINLSLSSGSKNRNSEVDSAVRRIRLAPAPTAEAIVVTHNTLCDSSFQMALSRAEVPILLIGDEVHNLGREEFVSRPPEAIPYRLGLSATPIRQYDPEGTAALQAYFGDTIFSFTLEEAIGVCLVPYDYHVHTLQLTENELDNWMELTERIKKAWWKANSENQNDSPYIQLLRQRRRLILESAEAKLQLLSNLLEKDGTAELKYTLIYATDKDPNQLVAVNDMLRAKGIRFHELTATETGDRNLTRRVLDAFTTTDLQVLTAKRVLDEGVNIPQISKAFILASTTVERQWVQRRGRLLRKCKEIGKDSSVVHDFLVVPPDVAPDADTKTIVKGELARVREFARLSRNFGAKGGALGTIDPIVKRFFSDPEDMHATS